MDFGTGLDTKGNSTVHLFANNIEVIRHITSTNFGRRDRCYCSYIGREVARGDHEASLNYY